MIVGLYAYQTKGKVETTASTGIKKILEDDSLCLDMLLAPEFTNIPLEHAKALSEIDPETILIPGTTMTWTPSEEKGNIYNRAHILKDGEVLGTYDKKQICMRPGYAESEHFNGHGVYTNGTKPGMFNCQELLGIKKTMGLEICRDNDKEVEALKREYGRIFDMQILLSCGCNGIANAINRNGYFICVDGNTAPTARVENSMGTRLRPQEVKYIGADPIEQNDKLYVFHLKF